MFHFNFNLESMKLLLVKVLFLIVKWNSIPKNFMNSFNFKLNNLLLLTIFRCKSRNNVLESELAAVKSQLNNEIRDLKQ